VAEQVKPHKVEITHMGNVPGPVEATTVNA
jgi:hypothetical protein